MWAEAMPTVFGMVERQGRIHAQVVPDRKGATLGPLAKARVLPSAVIYTDDFRAYQRFGRDFDGHRRINHSARIYVSGDVHTNTIEGFFGNFKAGIKGNYHAVSEKWLQGYVNEYVWRYNHRRDGRAMFETLLMRAAI